MLKLALHLAELDELMALARGEAAVSGIRIAVGALPPMPLINAAIIALESGMDITTNSFFLFIREPGHIAVGSAGFRGLTPDGRVEVGYGVAPKYQRQGVATRALELLVEVAFRLPEIQEIYAETSVTNLASKRVVQKCGFQHLGQRDSEVDGIVDRWLLARTTA